ncbi:MAG: circularly permuted type 2 ATP-grasp protein [SAR86 cluster bacterium]|nr:circularly permuted type 2 ATP-grasp protein [SAR86 cluster bacterium]
MTNIWKKYSASPFFDEYFNSSKRFRPHTSQIGKYIGSLNSKELDDINNATESAIKSMGISFRVYSEEYIDGQDRSWPLDFIPRLIRKKEWNKVESGLKQRVKALNLFIEDCYNDQKFLSESDMEESLVTDSPAFKEYCLGMKLKHNSWSSICGSDLIKDRDGIFYVLEDNLRVPSGVGYMLENRSIMKRVFPDLFKHYGVMPVSSYPSKLYETLVSLSYSRSKQPEIVLLTPGIYNSAYFEHSYLAQQMGIDIVQGSDLVVLKDNFVYKKTIEGLVRVDVIYRRIDDDYLDPMKGNKNSVLGVAGLIDCWRKKNVSIINAPGCGIADDKAVYSFVPEMIRYFLKEEPLISNLKTYLMTDNKSRDLISKQFKDFVIKPVAESGGYGIVIGKNASPKEKKQTLQSIKNDPRNYIAQPLALLSTSPTFDKGSIEPRHLDLRPFVLSGEKSYVTVGGLTRVALQKGSTVVNSSQGGGSKDTWIVDK